MRLSSIQDKDMVNLLDGKKIGRIIDVIINENGNILSFIVQRTKFNIIPSSNEIEIKYNQIRKIGKDVILVDIKNLK